MTTPAFLLVCPICGKKYQGDPTKPNARYKCPADQADLVPANPAAEPPATPSPRVTQPTAPPRVTQPIAPPRVTQSIDPPQSTIANDAAMTAVLGSAGAAAKSAPADHLRTKPLGST